MSISTKNAGEAPALGPRLQILRKGRNLSLDALARLSGVSRSMLSQIERGQANPTVATVWALSEALHIEISELLGSRQASSRIRIDVASAAFTPEIRSEDGLCILKILSPAERAGSVEWYELMIAPGGALRSEPHGRGAMEHLTVIEGELAIEAEDQSALVRKGATARYPADVAHAIVNASRRAARALLIVLN
jgi:XRE family transcriptional regulator, regulator of sulfur utilization